ncbi:MAG: DUF3488 domain-containing protein [Zetaproteobacteria bacterium CG_4_9_14_3_um_filter_54_145]|nr:MAG: DUF3488 domain-containing protein [Zetaproteobacteria bacterium CG_4_10_14_3_um_filter_54_28]PJA28514.1 MAG: DUF3488 domain-containing protein [Zetaproteobacteria bacterium CG_4_9_14_3_um_filter_54_145]
MIEVAGVTGLRAERLTLAVLLCGIASLALSDFVSPLYWSLPVCAALLRLWRGPSFALSEMQASLVGWLGFIWVVAEVLLGRALVIAFTDFLLILAFAVVVEAATARNHLHRMLVGLFLLLAAAVLTDTMFYALPLLAMAWFLWRAAACLYGLGWPGGDLPAAEIRQDLPAVLLVIALAVTLFVAMPRFEFHTLLSAMQPRMETSGFSDSVRLGDFARELDTSVVMRIELAGSTYEPAQFRRLVAGRYWRGATLSQFTGKGWQKGGSGRFRQQAGDIRFAAGDGMHVAVYREASDHGYILWPDGLLYLDDLPQSVRIDDTGAMTFVRAPQRRLRLLMDIAPHHAHSLPMRAPRRLESDRSRTPVPLKAWVQRVGGTGVASVRLARIATELKGWQYDLNVAVDAAHPLLSFLQNRRGHCELYATTLALAARELGLPSRVVNGYYRGEWNQAGGFLLLRQLHAHSWTEVWLEGQWQRMDATPSARWQLSYMRFPTLDQLWETAKLTWYRYVLAFSDVDRAGLVDQLWQWLKGAALWLLGGALAVPLIWICYRSGLKRFQNLLRQHGRLWPLLDRWLKQRGVYRLPHQPLRTLPVPDGIKPERWTQFVRQWEMQAFGTASPWHRRELKRHLGALLRRG